MKLCIICKINPAVVADRNSNNPKTKAICRKCHAERLLGDLNHILVEHKKLKQRINSRLTD